jgi:pimeloyl-ACP methyl ester carboxylesterase
MQPGALVILFLTLLTKEVMASDMAREKRMADEIVDGIMDGDAVYLKSGDHEFLNIYAETDIENPRGAVIVLHGRGYHPDWEDVVQPLRVGLVDSGWNTLSMQMPVLEKTAKYYDYLPILEESFPRIEAGIKYLRRQGNEKIILVAHSCSVHMVMAWVDAGRFRDIDAYVGIGMGATDYKQPMAKPFPLEKIKVPVFDIYGEAEYPAVLRSATSRKKAIERAGNKKSKQQSIPNANHYFTDQGDALLEAVSSWLGSL